MAALREILARFSIETSGAEKLRSLDGSVRNTIAGLKSLAIVAGGAVVLGAVRKLVVGVSDQAEALAALSAKTGQSTRSLQQWGFIGEQFGVRAESMAAALQFLTRRQGEALAGSKDAVSGFSSLGVATKDAAGQARDSGLVLREAVAAIQSLPSAAERAAAAQEVFGRGARDILPILSAGTEEIDKHLAAFDRLGGGLRERTIVEMAKFDEAEDNAALATLSLKGAIAELLSPSLTRLTVLVTNGIVKLRGWVEKLDAGRLALAGVAVLGPLAFGSLGRLLGIATSKAGLLTLGLVGAFLVIEDLIGAYQGAQSAAGDYYREAQIGTGDLTADMEPLVDLLRLGAFFAGEMLKTLVTMFGLPVKIGRTIGEGINRFLTPKSRKTSTRLAANDAERDAILEERQQLESSLRKLPEESGGDAAIKRADIEHQLAKNERALRFTEARRQSIQTENEARNRGTFFEKDQEEGPGFFERGAAAVDRIEAINASRRLLRERAALEGKDAHFKDVPGQLEKQLERTRRQKALFDEELTGLQGGASTGQSSELETRLLEVEATMAKLNETEARTVEAMRGLGLTIREQTERIVVPAPNVTVEGGGPGKVINNRPVFNIALGKGATQADAERLAGQVQASLGQ